MNAAALKGLRILILSATYAGAIGVHLIAVWLLATSRLMSLVRAILEVNVVFIWGNLLFLCGGAFMSMLFFWAVWDLGHRLAAWLDDRIKGRPRPLLLLGTASFVDTRSAAPGLFSRATTFLFHLLLVGLILSALLAPALFGSFAAYLSLSSFHQKIGVLFFFLFLVHTYLVVRKTRPVLFSTTLALYPLFFIWVLAAPTPVALTFQVCLFLFPIQLFFHYMEYSKPEKALDDSLWFLTYYFLTLVAVTGLFSFFFVSAIRFATFFRELHPLFSLAAILFLLFRWVYPKASQRFPGYFAHRRLALNSLILVAVGLALFVALKGLTQSVLAEHYQRHEISTHALAKKEGRAFVALENFDQLNDSRECQPCHKVSYDQWSLSAHAYATKNLPFQRTARALAKKHGTELLRKCATCHEPAIAFSDDPALLIDPEYVAISEGVSCRSCHYMGRANDTNGEYALHLPRVDLAGTDPDQRARSILVAPLEHVKDVTKPIGKNSASCFPCHSLDTMRQGHKLIPYDNVTSYQGSEIAKDLTCHSCHMPRLFVDYDGYSWMDHRFFGSHTLLDRVAIEPDEEIRKRLEQFSRDQEAWLQGALDTMGFDTPIYDETVGTNRIFNYAKKHRNLKTVFEITSGKKGHFDLKLDQSSWESDGHTKILSLIFESRSRGVSHDFPSALFANLSRTWFELTIEDATGRVLHRIGSPNDLNSVLGRIEVFDDQTPILPDQSLEYTQIINRRWIKPDQPFLDSYRLKIDAKTTFPLKATYSLQHLRYTQSAYQWIMEDEHVRTSPVRMAQTIVQIPGPGDPSN